MNSSPTEALLNKNWSDVFMRKMKVYPKLIFCLFNLPPVTGCKRSLPFYAVAIVYLCHSDFNHQSTLRTDFPSLVSLKQLSFHKICALFNGCYDLSLNSCSGHDFENIFTDHQLELWCGPLPSTFSQQVERSLRERFHFVVYRKKKDIVEHLTGECSTMDT